MASSQQLRMVFLFLFDAVFISFTYAADEDMLPMKGPQGLSIECDTPEKMDFILQYQDNNDFDFLRIGRLPEGNVEVLVKAVQVYNFKEELNSKNIKYKISVEDYQKVVEAEFEEQNQVLRRSRRSAAYPYYFDHFPRHETINQYMNAISQVFPEVTLFTIGKSYENRPIWGVQISKGGGENKPAILIDAGIHAREWIGPPTALFAIQELLKEENKHLYEKVDWYIIPLLNPDGYEFTHMSPENRFWRKTRSNTSQVECMGVDMNRNFDIHWDSTNDKYSNDPCGQTFRGRGAFSEIESWNLAEFILSKTGRIKAYFTLHSYGKFLLHPWGYDTSLPENANLLSQLGQMAANKISEVRGTDYTVGSSARVLYPAAGGSDDWAMAVGGVDLSYTIELPSSTNSFVVPPSEIIPIGLETFKAFEFFGTFVEQTYAH